MLGQMLNLGFHVLLHLSDSVIPASSFIQFLSDVQNSTEFIKLLMQVFVLQVGILQFIIDNSQFLSQFVALLALFGQQLLQFLNLSIQSNLLLVSFSKVSQ